MTAREITGFLRHIFRLRLGEETERFFKFGIIGLSGVGVSMGSLWLLTEVAHLPYLLSGAIAMELAITSNFYWNDIWTFKDRVDRNSFSSTVTRWLKFNISRLGSAIVGWAIFAFFTEVVGVHYLLSNLFAIVVATVLNYSTSYVWVWRKRAE